jgi:hypothetical protein
MLSSHVLTYMWNMNFYNSHGTFYIYLAVHDP